MRGPDMYTGLRMVGHDIVYFFGGGGPKWKFHIIPGR